MTDLSLLRTSLTKHGAHKLAILLGNYATAEVMSSLTGAEPGVNIDKPQARANLSVDRNGNVPLVWDRAKAAGSEAVGGLVLIGIILSHGDLISAFRRGARSLFRGTLTRGEVISGKSFTNTANSVEVLGYSTSHTREHVEYNFARLFEIPGLHELTLELVLLKFKDAKWDGSTNLLDEIATNRLHEIFSVTEDQFRNWLTTGNLYVAGDSLEDEGFFLGADGASDEGEEFAFAAGHRPRATGTVAITAAQIGATASLVHNELQTVLYSAKVALHGAACVGTEQPTGHGTSIDLVVKTATFCWFYEIKVAKSVKAAIRQAIPQLLEYAYWRDDTNVADRLVIASRFPLTSDAQAFIELLRTRFDIPLYYEQIQL